MSDKQESTGSQPTSSGDGPTRTRSPNFPAFTLEMSIKRAKAILDAVGRVPTSEDVLAELWKLSVKSSGFRMMLAAMKAYGLLSEQPAAKGTLLKLSNLGLDIVADFAPGSPETTEAIRKAALLPRVHATLFGKYGATLPADAEVRRYLLREHEPAFNDNTVDDFITKYKATIRFAGFAVTDKIEGGDEVEGRVTTTPRENRSALPFAATGWVAASPAAKPAMQLHPSSSPVPSVQEFPIPLRNGGRALLAVPVPLKSADYDLILATLGMWKSVLVEETPDPAE